jgi:outer membrane protein assembly factor BamA
MRKDVISSFLSLPVVLTLLAAGAYAQQTEIPPVGGIGGDPANFGGPADRIVDGRPRLFKVKRYLQPMTWLEGGLSPMLRSIDKLNVQGPGSETTAPKVSGIRFGLTGQGSSSGIGPQIKPFHHDLFGTGTEIELPLNVTYKLYESYGFRANYPLISDGTVHRLGVEFTGRYASRPSDSFFGVGNDSDPGNEARFRSVTRIAAVALDAKLTSTWTARLEQAYRSVGITRPRHFRSLTDVFPITSIPGLPDGGGRMTMTTASLERDTRSSRTLPDSGGLQRVQVTLNESRSGGNFSYWKYSADLQEFVPVSSDHRKVIVFRAGVETNQEKSGGIVPFFDLPTIGGHSTLRGFVSNRFTDKSAMNASVEYRYRIWHYMDWALFADTGQVAPEIGDFSLDRLHTGYGARIIVRAGEHSAVSFDVAQNGGVRRYYFQFNPRF